ncbi:MAG: hypothetical protein ABIB47_05860 [Candidatus Woesearchaeota archaeon]
MNKKGQGMPINTLIIIVLVVIVLLVVAFFFLGGTSNLSKSIRSVFFGATAGTDLSLAREICEQRCEAAAGVPTGQRTAYCDTPFRLDIDGDGNAEEMDGVPNDYYCKDTPISVGCSYGACTNAVEGQETWKKNA